MKDQILALRSAGKTYNEIAAITGASKGTIAYHCGMGQHTKYHTRQGINRKKRMIALKELLGAKCKICRYNRCMEALDFHHVDPATKQFNICQDGNNRSQQELETEAAKCVLLCANCHREIHAGVTAL